MIGLQDVADHIQNELNAFLHQRYEKINFEIWAQVGEDIKPVRHENTMHYFIPVIMRSVASANEGDILPMGVNSLSLDFCIPLQEPKTDAKQTPEDLQKVKNTRYSFVEEITKIVDDYFKVAKVFSATGKDRKDYTISLNAGRSITGTAGNIDGRGDCLIVNVACLMTYLQGGLNGRNVIIEIDGVALPTLNVTISRSGKNSADVYSNDGMVIKNIDTASALSIDFSLPYTLTEPVKQMMKYLLDNEINTAHFVDFVTTNANNVEQTRHKYLMKFENVTQHAEGVTFSGITASLVEINPNIMLIDFPLTYEIGKIPFDPIYFPYIDVNKPNVNLKPRLSVYCANQFFENKIPLDSAFILENSYYNPKTKTFDLYIFSAEKTDIDFSLTSTGGAKYEIVRNAK